MRIRKMTGRSRAFRIGIVFAVVATMVTTIATPSYAVAVALTLSQARGQSGGGNVITGTGATGAGFASGATVEFSYVTCAATYATPVSLAGTGTTLSAGVVAASTVVVTSATVLTITVPSGVALPTGMTSASLFVCSYAGSSVGSSLLTANTATVAYTILANTLTLSSRFGPSGGGNTVTATPDTGTLATGIGVEFQYSTCAATYTAAAAPAASSATAQTAGIVVATGLTFASGAVTITVPALLALVTSAGQTAATYSICVYSGTVAGTSLLTYFTTPGSYMIGTAMTLSPANGPSNGGNTIIAQTAVAGSYLAGTVVEFQVLGAGVTANCSVSYTTPATGFIAATDVRVLSDTRLAVVVPTGVTSSSGYNVCAYPSSTGVLITGTATLYTVSTPATLSAVTPTSGSAQGGTLITVTGTFPGAAITSASLGGTALTITKTTTTYFQATTASHLPGGPFTLAVTTASGTVTLANAFTYTNGIVTLPRNASNTGNVDLDVQGIGFVGITFSSTNTNGAHPNTTDGHVYLVQGMYDPTPATNTFKTLGQTLECLNVLVVSDIELVCTMLLAGNADSTMRPGAPTVTDLTLTSASSTAGSVTGGFSPSDVGLEITGTSIPSGTTITAVVDTNTITMSNNASGTVGGAGETATFFAPKAITDGGTTAASTTLSSSSLVATDVGRTIYGPGVAVGTTIVSVNTVAHTAVLTAAATATGTSLTMYVGATPVSVGTYTLTVVNDGSANIMSSTNPTYSQSVISSGSTFTVAPY
jgi:hypothetical protein